ncbi:homoserine dehydrogenase [Texcoconibacillus texcoconensis]|uniref:Homoserine dehydrogenase n=1 Tax=Texcoconibacillus texcoconensis TaxID=1095777 RepID=A0A840QN91_9BACI|nr:homoserine dehydrogenase [Texcoconibacillus texcoconensis]MBB5172844.1 homoserine dehydrogenase [Texcoconibacillus texcoconensis]
MSTVDVGILGFGTVGEGVYQTIYDRKERFASVIKANIRVPVVLVKSLHKKRNINEETVVTNEFSHIETHPTLSIVVEAMPDAKNAYPYVYSLLKRGVHVVSANKELIAQYGEQLRSVAKEEGVAFLYEASIAAGVPLLNTVQNALNINGIHSIEAIVNGTSNYILSEMKSRDISFAEALNDAQDLGYAEADPSKDVDGWDAYYKAKLLCETIYHCSPNWPIDSPLGIREIETTDLNLVERLGGKLKPLIRLEKTTSGVNGTVEPTVLWTNHPLFEVEGVDHAIVLETDLAGTLTLQGPGAGKYPTASAIVEDMFYILTSRYKRERKTWKTLRTKGEEPCQNEENRLFWCVISSSGFVDSVRKQGVMIWEQVQHPSTKRIAMIIEGKRNVIKQWHQNKYIEQAYPISGGTPFKVEGKEKVLG